MTLARVLLLLIFVSVGSWVAALGITGSATGGIARASLGKSVECQHPTTTGMEAIHLRNVTPRTACKLVIELSHWKAKWYVCEGISLERAGIPRLKIHRFHGWTLSLPSEEPLKMSRGRSSFGVIGTDFPINCS